MQFDGHFIANTQHLIGNIPGAKALFSRVFKDLTVQVFDGWCLIARPREYIRKNKNHHAML
jgi:hypothetical protein